MIIMKFGGSSLASSARMAAVSDIVLSQIDQKPLVVVSAMGDTTDWLLAAGDEALNDKLDTNLVSELHQKTLKELNLEVPDVGSLLNELENLLKGISLVKEISSHTRDYLVSFGERMSARILAAQLRKQGIKAQAFDAWDLGFQTFESSHGQEFDPQASGRIKNISLEILEQGVTPIITGYIAKSNKGAISTLGRGGSDLSATILGAILGVTEVQVWKDVNGILSADPRVVNSACEVRELSFEEASELAYFGTQVLHPRAIRPVLNSNIPVRVKNSYNPEHPGSIISRSPNARTNPVHLITSKSPVTLIDLVSSQMLGPHGYLSQLFQIFEKHQVSVDLLASSDISVSLTLDRNYDLSAVLPELQEVAQVSVSSNKAIVSLIADVSRSSFILSETFAVLEREQVNIQMLSQGCSKVKFSFVVDDAQSNRCVQVLHNHFFK